MVALGLAGLIVGLLLGLRFTAFVLLPVEIVALSVAVWVAMAGHAGWGVTLLGFLCFCVSSQTSYIVSLTLPAMLRSRSRSLA